MNIRLPSWGHKISAQIKIPARTSIEKQASVLKNGIKALSSSVVPTHKLSLVEQPFDSQLLYLSSLYRRSRELYLGQGGRFIPCLVTTPRTLSSSILVEQVIEYSPIEKELIWHATDRLQSKKPDELLKLRTYSSSLFHEQNHRILWQLLPSPPTKKEELRRYLNFAESMVIVSDMALADQLGENLASLFYLIGVTYDPGTSVYQELSSQREYRNYLQACLHATYLHLELYDTKDIQKIIRFLFPHLGTFADRASLRSGNLDPLFIQNTNLAWQAKHSKTVVQKLSRTGTRCLELPEDPLDNRVQYLIFEQWLDRLVGSLSKSKRHH